MLGVGVLVSLAGEFTAAILPIALALWWFWRAVSLVPEVMEDLEEREREEWRSYAMGPVLRCRQCAWVSYNANIPHCAECGAPLERVPVRNLS